MKKRNIYYVIPIILTAVVALGIYVYNMNIERENLETIDKIYGEQALNSLVNSVYALDEAMLALEYSQSAPLTTRLLAEVVRFSSDAVIAIDALPYSSYELETMTEFFNGTAEYASTLLWYTSEGIEIDYEQDESISALAMQTEIIKDGLMWIIQAYSEGALEMDGYAANSDTTTEGSLGYELMELNNSLTDFDELIISWKSEEDRDEKPTEVSEEDGKTFVAEFLEVAESEVEYLGTSVGELECLIYSYDDEQIMLTKHGGKLAQYYDDDSEASANISEQEAVDIAMEFLKNQEVNDVIELSRAMGETRCTIVYVRSLDGVIFDNNKITIGINLEDGTVSMYLATTYYISDAYSVDLDVNVTEEEALTMIPNNFEAHNVTLAVVTLQKGVERLCYEVDCSYEDVQLVVYIDAKSGSQEKILVNRLDE